MCMICVVNWWDHHQDCLVVPTGGDLQEKCLSGAHSLVYGKGDPYRLDTPVLTEGCPCLVNVLFCEDTLLWNGTLQAVAIRRPLRKACITTPGIVVAGLSITAILRTGCAMPAQKSYCTFHTQQMFWRRSLYLESQERRLTDPVHDLETLMWSAFVYMSWQPPKTWGHLTQKKLLHHVYVYTKRHKSVFRHLNAKLGQKL